MKAIPHDYQKEPIRTIARTLSIGRSILDASDMGTGKTYVALFALRELGLRPAVVCPKSMIPSWQRAAEDVGVEPLFVENIERIKSSRTWLKGAVRFPRWRIPADSRLIFDEVHRFSGTMTGNAALLAQAPRPCIMASATPIGDPTKLRAIGTQLGLFSWHDFHQWAVSVGCHFEYGRGLTYRGHGKEDEEVSRRINDMVFGNELAVRVRIADLKPGTFPDNRIDTRVVPVHRLTPADEAYLEDLTELLEECPFETVQDLRERQIDEHVMIPSLVEWVDDILADGRSQVAVFCNFRDTVKRTAEKLMDLKHSVGWVWGQQTDRQEHVDRFQSGEARAIICQSMSGGVGLNLHDTVGDRPRTAIHLPGWSAIDFRQCFGRCYRSGGKSPVSQYIVFGEGSFGARRVMPTLSRKLDRLDTITDSHLLGN